jgi:xanthine dehydrogenase accessory factor
MKEINAIVSAYRALVPGERAAMATLVRLEGSSYRRLGARMLVLDDGRYTGGISGGCLEGDALKRAQKTILRQKASIVTYDTTRSDGQQIGLGLGCNGIIDVMFSPVSKEQIDLLEDLSHTRIPQVLITSTDEERLGEFFLYNEKAHPEFDAAVEKCRRELRSATVEIGERRYFTELIIPQIHLLLYGGHHDVVSLVKVAKELGWKTSVIMNLLKAEKSLLGFADSMIDRNAAEHPSVDSFCAIMLMSHDYKTDKNNLQKLNSSDAFYIGILGPRNRTERMFGEFDEEGIVINNSRLYSPAGLDIGANTPEEIALSIAAEIRACASGREGRHLRERTGTIYGR